MLFNIQDTFCGLSACDMISSDDRKRYEQLHRWMLACIDPGFDHLCSDFARICDIELKSVADSGGILALVQVDIVIKNWVVIWNRVSQQYHELEGQDEKSLRHFLLWNASIAPSRCQTLPLLTAPALRNIEEWKSKIDSALHQRYEVQCGFLFNSAAKSMAVSDSEFRFSALDVLERAAPNVLIGDRFLRHIDARIHMIPLALSVKAKAYFSSGRSHGNSISSYLLQALLSDDDLKSEIKNVLESQTKILVPSDTMDLLFEVIVRADFCSLLKQCFNTAGVMGANVIHPSLPLRTKLSALSKKGQQACTN
jgi:hypothetical protein